MLVVLCESSYTGVLTQASAASDSRGRSSPKPILPRATIDLVNGGSRNLHALLFVECVAFAEGDYHRILARRLTNAASCMDLVLVEVRPIAYPHRRVGCGFPQTAEDTRPTHFEFCNRLCILTLGAGGLDDGSMALTSASMPSVQAIVAPPPSDIRNSFERT